MPGNQVARMAAGPDKYVLPDRTVPWGQVRSASLDYSGQNADYCLAEAAVADLGFCKMGGLIASFAVPRAPSPLNGIFIAFLKAQTRPECPAQMQ